MDSTASLTIYVTPILPCVILFLAVTGIFASFLLLPSRAYARTNETGRVRAYDTSAALTKAPHWEAQWLSPRLNVLALEGKHTSEFSGSRRRKARSLPKCNSPSHPITSPLIFDSKIRPCSRSILNRVSTSFLNCWTGNQEITNCSGAGDLFTADRRASENFSNIKPEPAERRVFFFDSHSVKLDTMPRTARGATWKEIAWKPALALAAIPWAVMCGFNAVNGEFFSREYQDKWQLRYLSSWPWWAWALISFAILVGVIGEGAFRAIRKREFQIGGLNEELQKQIQAERQATADFLRRSTEIINLRGEVENKKSEIDGLNSSLG